MSRSAAEGVRSFYALPWEPKERLLSGDPRHSLAHGGLPLERSGLTRRGVLYEYIRRHPGAHVRGIAKELSIATGDLQYHLRWLETHGFIKTRKDSFYRFVYPTMVFREEQEVLLGVLSQETPREILLSLVRDTAATQRDLSEKLGHSQPTISWQMEKLVQMGLVSRRRPGRELVYELAADRDDVLLFVKSYHPGVWKRWAGELSSMVVSATVKREGSPSKW